jgi:hypothetical protein
LFIRKLVVLSRQLLAPSRIPDPFACDVALTLSMLKKRVKRFVANRAKLSHSMIKLDMSTESADLKS